jgi:TrmH family RNA methyltransferase
MLITSLDNERIRRIRNLRERCWREQTGLYLVEGVQLVHEALKVGADVETIIVCPETARKRGMSLPKRNCVPTDIPVLTVSQGVFRAVAPFNPTQGMAAVVRQRWTPLQGIKPSGELCWIAANGLQCPSSLGTLMRLSDAVGGRGIILIEDRTDPNHPYTDPHHPSVIRASLGAVFSQRLVGASFREFAEWKATQAYQVVGTSPSGPTDYRSAEYSPPLVLFLGNEWRGLTPEQQAECDIVVRIPMLGRVPSHSVTTAASVLLYEVFARNRASLATGGL